MYPSPSIKPAKKAKKDLARDRYSASVNLFDLLVRDLSFAIPIFGKLPDLKLQSIGKVEWTVISVLFDSTISCPTHGIALIRLVITVAPHKDICPYGKTYCLICYSIN